MFVFYRDQKKKKKKKKKKDITVMISISEFVSFSQSARRSGDISALNCPV